MNRFAVWLLYVLAFGVISLTWFGSADGGAVTLLFLLSLIPCHLLIDWADKYYLLQGNVEAGPFSLTQIAQENGVGKSTQIVRIRPRWSSRWKSSCVAVDPPPRFGYGFLGLCLGAVLGLITGYSLFGTVKTPLTDAGGIRIDVAYVFESPKPNNYMYVAREADPTFKTVVREGGGIAGDSGVPVVNVLGKAVQATDRVIEEHNKAIDNAIFYMRCSTVLGALGLAVLFGCRRRYRLAEVKELPQTMRENSDR